MIFLTKQRDPRYLKHTLRDLCMDLGKLLNIALLLLPFSLCWYLFYAKYITPPFFCMGNIAVLALYAFLYALFANLYNGYALALSRISELIYSQFLAAAISDAVLYLITILLARRYVPFGFLLPVLAAQIVLSAVWSLAAHRLYFALNPPLRAILVWSEEGGEENKPAFYLERLKSMDRRFHVVGAMSVNEYCQRAQQDAQAVFLCGACHGGARDRIIQDCIKNGRLLYFVPEISDMILSGAKLTHLFYQPFLEVRAYHPSLWFLFAKRCFDVILSLVALVLLSPLMAVVALIVRRDGGSVFYRQERLTKDGKVFRIFKFRSMSMNAEQDGVARLSTGEHDTRITPVGHILRRYRIDELPQLINILRGEMSIVGPRPERPEIAAQYEKELPEFALRLQAKAGLTGYAQVYGKYNTTPHDKLLMDLQYLANPGLLQDLKIIFATVKILFEAESTEGVPVPPEQRVSEPVKGSGIVKGGGTLKGDGRENTWMNLE